VSLLTTKKPLGFHMIVNMNFALNIKSRLCDHVISRQSLHATWWCIQEKPWLIIGHNMMSSITFGSIQTWQHHFCIFLSFSRKSCINRCGTQCKWNDLKPIESHKDSNIIEWATRSVSDIEWADLKGDLSNITRILVSRSSRRGFLVRISSWRSWRPSHTSVIQNSNLRSL
jgi:hypothetical protein